MTGPAQPPAAPPAPVTGEGQPPAPAPSAPPAQPPAAPPAPPAFDPSTLSPEAKAWLDAQVAEADKKARVGSKENARAEERAALLKEFGQALGFVPKEGETPDAAALQREIDGLKGGSKSDKREIALLRYASTSGVNAGRLSDSRTFMAKVDKLDPGADDFAAELTKLVDEAVKADPTLKAGTPAVAPGAGEFGTGPGSPPATSGDAAIIEMEKALGYRK